MLLELVCFFIGNGQRVGATTWLSIWDLLEMSKFHQQYPFEDCLVLMTVSESFSVSVYPSWFAFFGISSKNVGNRKIVSG